MIEVRMTSHAIVARPGVMWATDNDKDIFALEGRQSESLPDPAFPVLPRSFFWISSYLNTAEKK